MTGIASTLSIAGQALSAQQGAINVTGQNIANVNNTGYSRQLVTFGGTQSISYGKYLLGNGTSITQVRSATDQLMEERLAEKKSSLSAYTQMAACLDSMEAVFSMDSKTGLNAIMSDFWNSWQDLANNPGGESERATERRAVYDAGQAVSEAFNTAEENLSRLTQDINDRLDASVTRINDISTRIADLNREIVSLEADGVSCANDLRDQRQTLISELSGLVNVDTAEQSNGTVTLTTGGGAVLVSGTEARELAFTGGAVVWQGASGDVDITDKITSGDMGGWLTIRDQTIPGYQADLNALADAFAWQVNSQHAQGCGQTYFTAPLTGASAPNDSGLLATLPHGDKIDFNKDFTLWIENSSTAPPTCQEVSVDLSAAAPVDSPTISLSGRANSVCDSYTFTLTPPNGVIGGGPPVTVAWSNGITEGTFTVSAVPETVTVDGMDISFTGATGPLAQGTFTITTDTEGRPAENVSSYSLTDFVSDFNTAATAAGGGVTASVVNNRVVFTPDSANHGFAFADDSGLAAALGVNTFFTGNDAGSLAVNDVLANPDLIAAAQIDPGTGEIAAGDNTNALAMDELQSSVLDIPRWTFERGRSASSTTDTMDAQGYYQGMVSSLGIDAQSIDRQKESAQLMANDLQAQRDAISAVSLDEEMINLTKFQAAYSAASKLLTVADEMLNTLLSMR